jgi:hypothetical protein
VHRLRTCTPRLPLLPAPYCRLQRRSAPSSQSRGSNAPLQSAPSIPLKTRRNDSSSLNVAGLSDSLKENFVNEHREPAGTPAKSTRRDEIGQSFKNEDVVGRGFKDEDKIGQYSNEIRRGFRDFCDFVPGLEDGDWSKSTILDKAADYVEEIVKGNDDLKARLTDLKTREYRKLNLNFSQGHTEAKRLTSNSSSPRSGSPLKSTEQLADARK